MKKVLLVLVGISMMLPVVAQQKKDGADIFPDGTPISEWFLQSEPVSINSLGKKYDLSDYGFISDPNSVQTEKIQAIIDEAAANGGGVICISEGIYKTGALFFKQGTHLHLTRGAILLGSESILDFPLCMTRIEGETCKFFPALINAENLNGFTISGSGIIDGNGTPYWKAFRLRHEWNPKCTNKDEMRPRLVYMSGCRNVQISGVTLQNSPFWTSHFYQCDSVKILDVRYFAPNKVVRSPSTDGIDMDVCSNFLIKGCQFTLNDDAICFKGGKGPYADKDSTNGSVTNVLIEDCLFHDAANTCMTCGSEAVHVRNILMRNCRVEGEHSLFRMKMRPDTPQRYEYITIENITGFCKTMLGVGAWEQFFDLKGRKDSPMSYANNITLRNINLKCDNFISAKKDDKTYQLSEFLFEDIKVEASSSKWDKGAFKSIKLKNIIVNEQQHK